MKYKYRLLFLFLFSVQLIWAQEKEEEFKKKIRGAIMMANSHVPLAAEGGKTVFIIPTWGADIDYCFHKRWSVALQADLKLQSFEVEENGVLLTRNYPLTLSPVIHYHTLKNFSFYVGPGYEFENNKNLKVLKLGTEYSFELNEKFEIALNLSYENKQEIYDSYTFGVAFNWRLWQAEK
jgi:hypothetical protein